MKTYRVTVEVTYTQHIEVLAANREGAVATAFYEFDIEEAYQTDSRLAWITEIDNPSWLDQPLPAAPTQGETA